ncbi:claudin-20-like [Antennarius striatus]|uniref:claudin-20-like n=1 Tax=Antennarius striatus TaxID=241820 RepID=UPI0035B31F8A
MLSAALQILAFALALLGVLGTAMATLLPNWKVCLSAWAGAVTPVSRMGGLWTDCVWFSSGAFSCTVKPSPLSLPPALQTARAGMVLSCLVGAFGLCLASLGLKCTRWGGSRRAKAHTAVAAGGCLVLAALLALGPASWFTHQVVSAFLTTDLPDNSKYQPGGALCVTFISAGFLLAGGVIFCLSCPGTGTRRPEPPPGRFLKSREPKTGPSRTEDRMEEGEQENGRQGNPQQEREGRGHLSPARLRPQELKDSYSLQEYV